MLLQVKAWKRFPCKFCLKICNFPIKMHSMWQFHSHMLLFMSLQLSYVSIIKIKTGPIHCNLRSDAFTTSFFNSVFWMYNSEMSSIVNTHAQNMRHRHQSCHGECRECVLTNIRYFGQFAAINHDGVPTDAQLIKSLHWLNILNPII